MEHKSLAWIWIALAILVVLGGGFFVVDQFAQSKRRQNQYRELVKVAQESLANADELDAQLHEGSDDPQSDVHKRQRLLRDEVLFKAKEYFEKASDLDESSPVPHVGIGKIEYYLERYEQAVDQFARAEELGDRSADLNYQIGRAYFQWARARSPIDRDKLNRGVTRLEQATRLDPDHFGAHQYLAAIYADPKLDPDPLKLKVHEDAVLRLQPDSEMAAMIRKDREAPQGEGDGER